MALSKKWIAFLAAAVAIVAIFAALIASAVPFRSDTLQKRIVDTLSTRLNSDVTLDDLSLRVLPRLHAEGTGLTIRDRRRPGVPPLIVIKSFVVDGSVLGVWRRHVSQVELRGLDISIPPNDGATDDQKSRTANLDHDVVIDSLISENARLIILPGQPGRNPKTWAIHSLQMHRVGISESMPFTAVLTNAVPPGVIRTEGSFGAWDVDNPGRTPLQGSFTFDDAHLDVFNGIGGTLSSRGSFGGSLNYIETRGETDTPGFVVKVGGHPFRLTTTYHAIVDGTNGDTQLKQIDAQFLKTTLTAKGTVFDAPPGQKGRTVSLDVTIPHGRIEDVMKMAVKADRPPLVGGLQLTTTFVLPPGSSDVVDRLRLKGRFSLSSATFTNRDVQNKIVALSRRGRGKLETDVPKESIASEFRGRFVLGSGRLDLANLMFAVPGAQVRLAGAYALKTERLGFTGNLLLDAKISETVSGFRSVLLKIVDPIFRRDGGGSSIPIRIEGTRNDPKFGVDLGRVFKRGN